jgi:hypothetical protein
MIIMIIIIIMMIKLIIIDEFWNGKQREPNVFTIEWQIVIGEKRHV